APFKSPVKFSYKQGMTACTSDAQCGGLPCLPPATNGGAMAGTCGTATSDGDVANFAQLVADAAEAVGELRAANVDLVVALCHVGVDPREVATIQATGMLPANPISE